MSNLRGVCPFCDSSVSLPSDVEVSEIIYCSDCRAALQIVLLDANKVVLEEAPSVEEDWGE